MPTFRIWLLMMLGLASLPAASIDPASVAVVAVRNVEGSETLARALMQHRGIPANHLILLDLAPSTSGSINRRTYEQRILQPLRLQLTQRGLLSNNPQEPPRVRWLVLCYGMPWLIRAEPGPDGKPLPASPSSEAASVDSELASLAMPEAALAGSQPNPFFNQLVDPPAAQRIIRTARLDGPTPESALQALRGSWEAEKRGLRGRAYIDLGGPYAMGEDWIRNAGEICQRLGFPTTWDEEKLTFRNTVRFDAPAWIFGWYEARPTGRLADPQLRLEPGAVAFHLHSFSAQNLRDPRGCWVARWVEAGAGLTVGNVAEPYLHLSLRPDVLMANLARGRPAGEAAWAATPCLSWMGIILGDPFYRPFATSLLHQISTPSQPGLGWACQRAALLEPRPAQREALLFFALQAEPNLANALAWAQNRQATGQPFAAEWPDLPPEVWAAADAGLLREAAEFLESTGMPAEAVKARTALPKTR